MKSYKNQSIMDDWQKECLKTHHFTIHGANTPITLFTDSIPDYSVSFVYTPRYRTERFMPKCKNIPLNIQTLQIHGYTEETEFIDDILFQIKYIENNKNNLTIPQYCADIVCDSCEKHIKKYGRLIDTDMLVYIDTLMHILYGLEIPILTLGGKEGIYENCISYVEVRFKDDIYMTKYPYGIIKLT